MSRARNSFLILGATFSALAALLHLGCIVFGAPWYRLLGAGEQMAQLAAAGHWYPTVITLAIAVVLSLWSLYALSGAGVISRLPFLRLALCAITGIYLLRGTAFVRLMPYFPGNTSPRTVTRAAASPMWFSQWYWLSPFTRLPLLAWPQRDHDHAWTKAMSLAALARSF